MPRGGKITYPTIWRLAAVAATMAAVVALGWWLHVVRGEDIVYTHLAYVPIVLAGFWWGRRGLWVVPIIAAAVFSFHIVALGVSGLLADVARVGVMAGVALCVALLRERVLAQELALERAEEHKRRELADLERQQEEQLLHSTRLAELGEMAAGIAHELNQPLTGIRNFARNAAYMLDHPPAALDEVRQNLRLIAEQVDRASRIITQMRELTRRAERHFAPLDLNRIARETVEFLLPQFRLSDVAVETTFDPSLPPVMGDKVRLEQVLLNLLTNARHALEGAPARRLAVRTRREPRAERPVVIEVEDTGCGFAPADAEKLFRPFYSTKAPERGTGLGLSISLTIIRDHGGRIEAAGEPGRGARFTVSLPACEAQTGVSGRQ